MSVCGVTPSVYITALAASFKSKSTSRKKTSQEVSVMYMYAYYYENLVYIEYLGSLTCSVTRHFQNKNSLCLNLNITNPILNPTTCFFVSKPDGCIVPQCNQGNLCKQWHCGWRREREKLSISQQLSCAPRLIVGQDELRWSVARIQHYRSFYGFFGQNSNLNLGDRFKFTIYIRHFSAFSPFSEGLASPFL